jgi:hypothetical protein
LRVVDILFQFYAHLTIADVVSSPQLQFGQSGGAAEMHDTKYENKNEEELQNIRC